MPTVGQSFVDTLTIVGGDNTTAVTVSRISPSRTVTAVTGAATSDGGESWSVTVPAPDVPGLWWVRWTITGAGAGVHVHQVDVAPSGYPAAAPRAYATTTDLADYLYGTSGEPQPLPDGVEGKLFRASARVDRLLKSSVYDVDDDGMPTDDKHIEAMKLAVCEWVAWWEDTGDESGVGAGAGFSVTAGRISLSRSAAPGGGGAHLSSIFGVGWVPAQTVVYLDNAGLLGHAPYIC